MNKNLQKLNLLSITSGLILICYLCIGFIPNLSAVDKIAPQWLTMTILNGISILYLAYNLKYFSISISSTLRSPISIVYIVFIVWASLSYFYAINPTEVIVNITRQVNVLLMYLVMGVFLFIFKNKIKFICWVIAIILGLEIYAVIIEAQSMINLTGTISSGELKGVTANRNITAFSIAIKIPFLLYLIHTISKKLYKIMLTILFFLALLCLSMIQSRASFVGIIFILVGFVLMNLSLYLKNKKYLYLLRNLFFLVPLLFAVLVNQVYLSSKGADAISRAATISISTNDGSVNQRLRYYEDVLTHLSSNPIFGVGLGNWKLKSIEYDANDIVGYVVPYHAHSDFIQLGAELGVIGFVLYLAIFLLAIYFSYNIIRNSKLSEKEKVFIFLILLSLGVYSIDANLNFPIARPQVLVVWSCVLALITVYNQKHKTIHVKSESSNDKLNKVFLILGILIIIPSAYVTNLVYKSLKGQMFLLQDFNSNQYNLPINQLENIVPSIPNITVTTIPIESVKARYYFKAKKYRKAIELIDEGTKANPYLFYSEILKSQIYQELGKLDSAKYYAKKAFYGLPNNDLHSSAYLNLISKTRDKKSLDEAFETLILNNKVNNWKNYLIIASSLYLPGDKFLINKADVARKTFQGDQEFEALYRQIYLGEQQIIKARNFSNKGLGYFDNLDYENAAIEFENAIKINPLDYAYYENAATSFYMTGNLNKALDYIDKVINDLNPLNGKCEYIKALIFIRMGDPIGACPLLAISAKSGFSQSNSLIEKYCSQGL